MDHEIGIAQCSLVEFSHSIQILNPADGLNEIRMSIMGHPPAPLHPLPLGSRTSTFQARETQTPNW